MLLKQFLILQYDLRQNCGDLLSNTKCLPICTYIMINFSFTTNNPYIDYCKHYTSSNVEIYHFSPKSSTFIIS